VAITAAVEFLSGETVATAPPEQIETLLVELLKQRWELSDNQGRSHQSTGNLQPE
jgi:hypothetical protein